MKKLSLSKKKSAWEADSHSSLSWLLKKITRVSLSPGYGRLEGAVFKRVLPSHPSSATSWLCLWASCLPSLSLTHFTCETASMAPTQRVGVTLNEPTFMEPPLSANTGLSPCSGIQASRGQALCPQPREQCLACRCQKSYKWKVWHGAGKAGERGSRRICRGEHGAQGCQDVRLCNLGFILWELWSQGGSLGKGGATLC